MNLSPRSARRWARTLLVVAVLVLALSLLWQARAGLVPFILGAVSAYLMLPLVNRLDNAMRPMVRWRRFARSLAVFVVYGLAVLALVVALAYIVPTIASQISYLAMRLPYLVARLYKAAPDVVQIWLEQYNSTVPENVRLAIAQSVQNTLQSLLLALQTGVIRTFTFVFSTVSFVIGLLIVPLWMFFVLRDQPEINATLYRVVPPAYRDDVRSLFTLLESVLGAYLRGQFILCLSVGVASAVAFLAIGLDFAVLLGTLAGIFEMVPMLGPTLGAIPALLVALATSPDKIIWVVVLAVVVQQLENTILVPQISAGTARLHPAVVMVVLVAGTAVGGVAGALLSVPLTASVRDVALYLYYRLADQPLGSQEALARVRSAARPA
jgi:predicted PurR-regulated permease PerM